ncbi:MAG: adenylate cyclase [Planctomycetaceae bacterium]|nr:MAG: adenylate cyclase [Planctomycetaceae bacterium]
MPWELIAQGPTDQQRWQIVLDEGACLILGRDANADVVIPWDSRVSRRHARLHVYSHGIQIRRLPEAKNPLFFRGEIVTECLLTHDQQCVLGETQLLCRQVSADPAGETPLQERAFNAQQLRRIRYHDPENRLEVLTHLPAVIAEAESTPELYASLGRLMLRGVVHAEAVAVVSCTPTGEVVVHHCERRRETAGPLRPSRRLVHEAIEHRKTSVLHVWHATESSIPLTEPTLAQELDWAFCTPVSGLCETPGGLYLTGHLGTSWIPGSTLNDASQLDADVKFTELVGEILAAVLKARKLERQKAGLRQFFAPPILKALGDDLNTTLLEPTECEVTVLFCDLRGFSLRAEQEIANLIGLLERVSRALGVMTQHILAQGGVTGDFQGDAALGFWGWPFATPDAPLRACRAALGIRAAFARAAAQPGHPLADFTMGIGIAHGRAVAGKIGTAEQVKVTVFGPVVNLAQRLESMTKTFRTPILLDEATARIVREKFPPTEGRIRKVARVQPYGLETPVQIAELLPSVHDLPELTDEHLNLFEQGVEHFQAGRWDEAYRAFHHMPAADRAPDFLVHHITQHGRVAPSGWDGVLRLPAK